MKRPLLPVTLALALALAAPALAQEARAPETFALTDAHVHPVSGPAIAGATVIVRGGKIRAIGKVAVPGDAHQIDLGGAHLYPGLIDADTVLGLAEIGSVEGTRDTREVGRINPNLRAEVALNPDSHLLPVARTGGVLLAHIAARSGLIAGTSAVIETQGWTYEDMTLRSPVFLHVRWPTMNVARQGKSKDEVAEALAKREEALAAIRGAFREARAYVAARRSPTSTRARDLKWEAMRPVIAPARGQRRVKVAVHAETQAQIEAALEWASDEKVAVVLVGGADAWRLAQKLRDRRIPVILGRTFRLPRRAHEALDTPYALAGRLHQAGVQIAFSTGGSGFSAANARNLRLHAAAAVGHGLPRSAALRALTLSAAEILGVQNRVGSLEVGKDATFFVCDKDVLDDAAQVTRAWIGGREVKARGKQLDLYERYRNRPRR